MRNDFLPIITCNLYSITGIDIDSITLDLSNKPTDDVLKTFDWTFPYTQTCGVLKFTVVLFDGNLQFKDLKFQSNKLTIEGYGNMKINT